LRVQIKLNKDIRHYPIGLLFDIYSTKDSLPWSITLHFKDLPTDTLLLKPTPETMQDMFMAMVKEVILIIQV
jgi:autophagy-related protein 5